MKGILPVATRIWMGLRGDRPTLALVFGAPVLIFLLFRVVIDAIPPGRMNVDFLRPVLLGIFMYLLTYLLTSVGFLRERQSGTLERVFASRITPAGLTLGYVLGIGVLAVVQSMVILLAGLWILEVDLQHNFGYFTLAAVLGSLSALGLGLLISLAARNEFQVIQFIPLVLTPQVVFGGVFVPLENLPAWAELIARAMPLTYVMDAVSWVVLDAGSAADYWTALLVLAGWTAVTTALAAIAVRGR